MSKDVSAADGCQASPGLIAVIGCQASPSGTGTQRARPANRPTHTRHASLWVSSSTASLCARSCCSFAVTTTRSGRRMICVRASRFVANARKSCRAVARGRSEHNTGPSRGHRARSRPHHRSSFAPHRPHRWRSALEATSTVSTLFAEQKPKMCKVSSSGSDACMVVINAGHCALAGQLERWLSVCPAVCYGCGGLSSRFLGGACMCAPVLQPSLPLGEHTSFSARHALRRRSQPRRGRLQCGLAWQGGLPSPPTSAASGSRARPRSRACAT